MKYIDEPAKLQQEILKKTYSLALIPLIYSLIRGEFATLLGFIFGLLIATLIFRLRLIQIERALDMQEKKASTFIRNRYFIEYIIYFVVLFVARKNPSVNFLAAAVGLFFVKLTVIGLVMIDIIKGSLEKKLESYR
ncbi:MAG: hypothetical protein PWR10_955 [Halanaerobiales bacterium]|nr:hypothetical protein [Halanaerobiales bacterium]